MRLNELRMRALAGIELVIGFPSRRWTWLLLLLALVLMGGSIVTAATSGDDPEWSGTSPVNISNSPQNNAWQPDIAIGSTGGAVVAWSDVRSGARDIYFMEHQGETWSAPEVVSASVESSRYPDMVVAGDDVMVAWVDGTPPTGIYQADRVGAGNWETSQVPQPANLVDTRARLAVGGGRAHLVFNAEKTVSEIYYTSRALTEATWPMAKQIYTSTAWAGSWSPALAVGPDGQTLHVVWQDVDAATTTIWYMGGTMNGADVNWATPEMLSTGITWSRWPEIAVDSQGDIHVVWGEQDEFPGYQVQYVRYIRYDAGSDAWMSPVRIDPDPVEANEDNPTFISPSIGLWERNDRVKVCAAWYGFRTDASFRAEDILMRCSRDGGSTWSATGTENVSHSASSHGGQGVSFMQSVILDGSGNLHVVWQEFAGGNIRENYEIYYSHTFSHVYLPLVARSW